MPLLRPNPILYVGELPSPLPRLDSIEHLPSDISLLEHLEPNQLLRKWDFVSQYNQDCLKPSEIEPLRHRSDPLADQVVDVLGFLGPATGRDAYEVVKQYVDLHVDDPGSDIDPVMQFWDEMNRLPPESVSGVPLGNGDGGKGSGFTPLGAFESTRSEPTLAEGQRIFWKYSGQIFVALMHFSLAGGFSSPKLAAVMHETNYLTSNAREATYKRLLETTLFVLDAMEDMTVGTGRGWKSAMRVRLLHAQVRQRILKGKGRFNRYNVATDGVPINQADLLAVLGAFAVGPVWSMTRNGYSMSRRERTAYQTAWRHVGYYLGIEPALLTRYYGRTFETVESSFASLAYSIFPSGPPPSDPFSTPQYKILSAVAARPPRGKPIGHHLELCRLCIGPELSNQLALPRGTWKDYSTVEIERLLGWSLLTFGHVYSTYGGMRGKRWEERRRDLFRWIVKLLVVWQLGQRRTVFAWRDETKHGDKLGIEEGEDAGIDTGSTVGPQVKKEWRELMVEMAVVVTSVVAVGSIATAWIVKRFIL
ncbi:oxygenase MpaB family protein [Sporobolomyces koalae]|uniref:oxygenase MpaB family protein n=1 Tax=Sporobolomyces koalae TaxID=500713 RepID=UPI0031729AFF